VLQVGLIVDEQPRPVSHRNALHETVSQRATFGVHLTSQPHELSQAMSRHDPAPLQVTSHLPEPHWMLRQDC